MRPGKCSLFHFFFGTYTRLRSASQHSSHLRRLAFVPKVYQALDSERNAAALWAKDSSPPWHKSYTISKRLRVSRLLEVLRTNGSGIVLLSITATLRLHHTCPCLVFLLQVCGPSWAATQGHPRSRCLKTRLLKIHGMVWNGMEWYGNRVQVHPASLLTYIHM